MDTPSNLTLREALDQFQADAAAGVATTRNGRTYRPATLVEYRHALDHPSIGHLHNEPLAAIRHYHVQRALDGAARSGTPGSTRRQIATALRTVWRWAHARGHCERSALEGLELPSVEHPRRAALDPVDAARSLERLRDPTVRACYAIALYTGARAQEIAALTWADIDRDGLTIRLGVDARARKSLAALRTVPITDRLADALSVIDAPSRDGRRALVPGARNPRQRAAWFRLRAARDLERTRWAQVRPHDLRHSWASWMLAAGLPLPAVRDLLGHESGAALGAGAAGITLDVYGHSLSGHVDQARRVMNVWLEQQGQPMT